MYTNEEKIQFSERLRAAIAAVDPDIVKAAELATQSLTCATTNNL